MRVVVNRERCVASGVCSFEAPEVFDQDDEGIVVVLKEEVKSEDLVQTEQAIRSCPAAVIWLEE
jgi:ferredoxin